LTGIIGIIGVIVGSILTNISDKIKLNHFENKNINRKIYYKLFADLKYCFHTETAFRKEHDVAKKVSISDLKNNIEILLENNMDILNNELFSIYYCLKSTQYFDDFRGEEFSNIDNLDIFSNLLLHMHLALRKTKMVNKDFLNDIEDTYYCYKIWHLLMVRFQNWDTVYQILQMKWEFKKTFKEIYKNKNVIKLLGFKNITDERTSEIFMEYCKNKTNLSLNKLLI
jgi:hypothetical protein